MITIHVFQMDINCILMKYTLNNISLKCMIIIHVFQMDIICILIKCYLNVHLKYMNYDHTHYLHFNEILFSCLLSQFIYFKWTLFAF